MNRYLQEIKARKKELETAIKVAEAYLKSAPDGKLRSTSGGNGYPEFYYVTDETGSKGKYIRKKDYELARALIQKEYSTIFLKDAGKELAGINRLIKYNQSYLPENTVNKLNRNKRGYVDPYIIDDATFAENWQKENFITNDYHPEEKKYPTKNGEMVRSKSEAMLADMYYDLGIPYRYEAELVLKDGRVKYPDFTLLDVKRRKVIYHEHMGLLDDEEYRANNLIKLNNYRKSGIYFGKNLIMTFETEYCPLNIMDIRASVMEMFEI